MNENDKTSQLLVKLAQSLANNDYDKVCQLNCGKTEWAEDDNHKHHPGCPFALAYEVLKEAQKDDCTSRP